MNKNQYNDNMAKALASPTAYVFDFKDVPIEKYAQTLDVLFRHPDFIAGVEKRNRLLKSASNCKSKSSEVASLIRIVQQHDRKLADILYAAIVQTNIHSDSGLEYFTLSTLLHFYVDYSRDGMSELVKKLTANLYKVTFLADMLESVMVDVRYEMRHVFGENFQYQQFDGVLQVLNQLRGFFNSVRTKDYSLPETQLFWDYADSINDYLAKRLKTYVAKYNKIHPEYTVYTDQDVIDALNAYFSTDIFGADNMGHTDAGCPYVDIATIKDKLNTEQAQKLFKLLEVDNLNTKSYQTQCFTVTDLFIKLHKRPRK